MSRGQGMQWGVTSRAEVAGGRKELATSFQVCRSDI